MSFAQEIVYREPANKGYTRFYYDENYYLVDKNCEFKSIERVAQYDTVMFGFNGEFKDFDRNGKLILEGSYQNGNRNGPFKAYHPNGQLKWEAVYQDGREISDWKYYYPDGKPFLTLSFGEEDYKIMSYWDRLGEQKVIEGNGNYDITFPATGFSDHGYSAYRRHGKLVNGVPDGVWYINFITNPKKNTQEYIYREVFEGGVRTSFIRNPDYYDHFIPYEDFWVVPTEYFGRAEFFLVHDCSFDEYSGFTNFIHKKIAEELEELDFELPNGSFQYKVKYEVSKTGQPVSLKLDSDSEKLPKKEQSKIHKLFESMYYFIPSIENGKAIKDNISLMGEFLIRNGKGTLNYVKIQREKGQ